MRHKIDLDRLLKLRLIVARHGEMDGARWWNTNGVLGPKGSLLMSRGFPKTHHFAQARLVFEVARTRSAERFAAVSGCITLWNLPADVEDEFNSQWAEWLDNGDSWVEFFDELKVQAGDLLTALRARDLLDLDHDAQVSRMRRSAEGRSVPISSMRRIDDDTFTLLAAGFSRGEVGKPAIPYARVDG
ncbi:BrxE family protein [Candidatus Halocynthiibacter alkanivorans]|uniref:BrxE family protein n=1 Tax=Candidatus Halocynthiibacter alkanivorans TaxID=2267619 RepID=UPI000DF20A65|nr:BrxE family protein [Candidatus Halocynthiibacter alkanivorans]